MLEQLDIVQLAPDICMTHLSSKKINYSELVRENVTGEGGYAVIYQGTYQGAKVAIKELKNLKTKHKSMPEPITAELLKLSSEMVVQQVRVGFNLASATTPEKAEPEWSAETRKVCLSSLSTTSFCFNLSIGTSCRLPRVPTRSLAHEVIHFLPPPPKHLSYILFFLSPADLYMKIFCPSKDFA